MVPCMKVCCFKNRLEEKEGKLGQSHRLTLKTEARSDHEVLSGLNQGLLIFKPILIMKCSLG